MKSQKLTTTLALLFLCLSVCAGTGVAATIPLNGPLGLA